MARIAEPRYLDQALPRGAYELDAYLPKPSDVDAPDFLELYRSQLNRLVRKAFVIERAMRATGPETRERARFYLDDLAKLQKHLNRIAEQNELSLIDLTAAFVPNHDNGVPAYAALLRIQEDARSLVAFHNYLVQNYKLAAGPPSRTGFLEQTFLFELGGFYLQYFRECPPRSSSGPFVEFAAAVWRDFHLPVERGRDLISVLGQRNEKIAWEIELRRHPAMDPKKT